MPAHLQKLLPALALLAFITPVSPQAFQPGSEPLAVARILAERYPGQAGMSYIPAPAWAGQLPFAALSARAPRSTVTCNARS